MAEENKGVQPERPSSAAAQSPADLLAEVEFHDDEFTSDGATDIDLEEKKLGLVQRLVGILFAPDKVMRNIKKYPVFGGAFLLSLILSIPLLIIFPGFYEITLREVGAISIERYGVDYMAQSMAAIPDSMETAYTVMTYASQMIGYVASYFVSALFGAILLIIVCKILGGNARFTHYFSLNMHLCIITAIGSFVYEAIGVATGSMLNYTSLAAFLMPDGNIADAAFNILSQFGVFTIWTTVLTYIGVKRLNDGFTPAKSAAVAIISFLFSTVIAGLTSGAVIWQLDLMDAMTANVTLG